MDVENFIKTNFAQIDKTYRKVKDQYDIFDSIKKNELKEFITIIQEYLSKKNSSIRDFVSNLVYIKNLCVYFLYTFGDSKEIDENINKGLEKVKGDKYYEKTSNIMLNKKYSLGIFLNKIKNTIRSNNINLLSDHNRHLIYITKIVAKSINKLKEIDEVRKNKISGETPVFLKTEEEVENNRLNKIKILTCFEEDYINFLDQSLQSFNECLTRFFVILASLINKLKAYSDNSLMYDSNITNFDLLESKNILEVVFNKNSNKITKKYIWPGENILTSLDDFVKVLTNVFEDELSLKLVNIENKMFLKFECLYNFEITEMSNILTIFNINPKRYYSQEKSGNCIYIELPFNNNKEFEVFKQEKIKDFYNNLSPLVLKEAFYLLDF